MGRHSAPDDDDADDLSQDLAGVAVAIDDAPRGQHARPDDVPEPAPVGEPAPVAEPAPVGEPAPVAEPARERPTAADLHLIRQHADVRARVIAAVIAPFVVFVVVLVVTNNLHVHMLVWIWAPAVAAGILVGLMLDAGDKRYGAGRDAGHPDTADSAAEHPAAVTEPADPA